jgi:hypothetical protein
MNYESVEEIYAAGTTNMTVLRNNTKNDDGSDSVQSTSWLTYNGTAITNINAYGNSYLYFNSNLNLNVNERDGAMYSLYREEGTLYNHYKFLKIRWSGYSYFGQTSADYALEYDIILWDTGDISLRMVKIPTKSNDGNYSLWYALPSSYTTLRYTVNDSSRDVTFLKNKDYTYTLVNSVISLIPPFESRYLISSNSKYYTIKNSALSELSISTLTASVFLNYGVEDIPDIELLKNLSNAKLLYWVDKEHAKVTKGLVVGGIPSNPQVIYYNQIEKSEDITITKMEIYGASENTLIAISIDGGTTWKYYNNYSWIDAMTEMDGMVAPNVCILTAEQWAELPISNSLRVRCTLTTADSRAGKLYVKLD